MTAMLKQFQSNPPPAQVKAVEKICVTCGGAHPYYQCLAADGNTFLEYRDNIQGYVSAATGNFNQDCLKDLVSTKQSGNPTFSLHKEIASLKVIPEFYDSKGCAFLSEELTDIYSFNDIHPYFDDDPLSGSTTYSANSLLEEFADELALISYPSDYDDNHSIDQYVLTNLDDLFVDPTPEMFTEEQPPDYSFPPRFDVYPDDFLEIESDATFDDDSFDSEGEKIKEAELLIDPLDLPCDILSEISPLLGLGVSGGRGEEGKRFGQFGKISPWGWEGLTLEIQVGLGFR
nr:hypothetical protein [Tanacetum cinerariifolium]